MSLTFWAALPSCSIFQRAANARGRSRCCPISAVGGLDSWQGDELVFGNLSYLNRSHGLPTMRDTSEPVTDGLLA